jgi:hypothetical protein
VSCRYLTVVWEPSCNTTSGISNSPESRSKEATGVTVLSEDKRTGEPNIVNAPLSYVKVAEYSLFPTVTAGSDKTPLVSLPT